VKASGENPALCLGNRVADERAAQRCASHWKEAFFREGGPSRQRNRGVPLQGEAGNLALPGMAIFWDRRAMSPAKTTEVKHTEVMFLTSISEYLPVFLFYLSGNWAPVLLF
jgi:hypothetical protein